MTKDNSSLTLSPVVVPHISGPVPKQYITTSKDVYEHLAGLDLADSGDVTGELEIDILDGSDSYLKLVTGRVVRGSSGPTAVETRLGWVLSGPAEGMAQEDKRSTLSFHLLPSY